jgi:pimeloyl-ACP methyl ester carboxylesterase
VTNPSLDVYRAAERALWRAFGADPSERFLKLDSGMRVRVQEQGKGKPALFIHGAMTAGSSFAPLVAKLETLGCIVLDRPGCGLSDPWQLEPEFRDQAIVAIGQVLDALELQSVILVGNSLGALWSTWFALAHPERVERLVLLGPSIGFAGVHPPAFMRIAAVPGVARLAQRMMRPTPASLRRIFATLGHKKSLEAGRIPDALVDWGVRLMLDTPTRQNDFEAVRRVVGVSGARRWTKLGDDALRKLSVPTLLLAGTDDPDGGPALATRASQLIGGSSVRILKDVGHVPWLDDPSTVAESVHGFATA